MDLASGYSDSINYGNGYTPLANNAIGNNNADYLRNQLAVAQAGQYDPFAQSGGFGAMTAAYAGAGADYGRAVGGGGNIYAPAASQPQANTATMFDGMSAADMATWQRTMYDAGKGNEIPASFNDRFSAAPAVDHRLQPTPAQQLPQGIYDGVFAPTTPRSVTIGDDFQSRFGNWPQPQPQPQQQQQPNSLPPFWQGVRDIFGADPKDQSRLPQDNGGYPGMTNPNYQPGGMAPQQPVPFRDTWTNAS